MDFPTDATILYLRSCEEVAHSLIRPFAHSPIRPFRFDSRQRVAFESTNGITSNSGYNKRVRTLTNLGSYFQKYRISKVLQIYTPRKNESVLDLGCGWGTFCFAVAPLCKEVTGLDFSRKCLALCNQLLAKSGYSHIKLVCADAQNTGLGFESYDVIICADLVEHLYPEAFENVLNECRRLLKPGGKLVIWTPHRGHLLEILRSHHILLKPDITHVDYKSMARLLEGLQKRRFSIQKAYYTESHLPVWRYLEKLLLPVLPIMRRRIAILAEKTPE